VVVVQFIVKPFERNAVTVPANLTSVEVLFKPDRLEAVVTLPALAFVVLALLAAHNCIAAPATDVLQHNPSDACACVESPETFQAVDQKRIAFG
jgi:hypothetical protein